MTSCGAVWDFLECHRRASVVLACDKNPPPRDEFFSPPTHALGWFKVNYFEKEFMPEINFPFSQKEENFLWSAEKDKLDCDSTSFVLIGLLMANFNWKWFQLMLKQGAAKHEIPAFHLSTHNSALVTWPIYSGLKLSHFTQFELINMEELCKLIAEAYCNFSFIPFAMFSNQLGISCKSSPEFFEERWNSEIWLEKLLRNQSRYFWKFMHANSQVVAKQIFCEISF